MALKQAGEALVDGGGGEIVALKRGNAGCTIFTEAQTVSVPGYEVDVVDLTGAGDCSDAGFVVGLTEDLPLEEIGRLANACGPWPPPARVLGKARPCEPKLSS